MSNKFSEKVLGSFTLKSFAMYAHDPVCAGFDVLLNGCLPGTWHAKVIIVDEGRWGNRNASLIIWHESIPSDSFMNLRMNRWVSVDAGVAGFSWADPNEHQDMDDVDTSDYLEDGIKHNGVFCSSGYGDGGYSVYYKQNKAKQIVGAELVFIMTDDDPRNLSEKLADEDFEKEEI